MNKNELVIVLDTETTNTIDDAIIYDLGFAVVEPFSGNVIATYSYVIAETFLNKDLMASAFFADKIPAYWEDIKNGKRQLVRLITAKKMLADVCKMYNIHYIVAHNARFDYVSCNTTQRYFTCSKYRFFFPFGIKIFDTLKMAKSVLKNDEKYCAFCKDNNYVTKNGQNRYTAEIIHRFLTNNLDFIEEHTGLEDVLIEKDILKHCLNCDENVNGLLW